MENKFNKKDFFFINKKVKDIRNNLFQNYFEKKKKEIY
jgi:hypothetical protein